MTKLLQTRNQLDEILNEAINDFNIPGVSIAIHFDGEDIIASRGYTNISTKEPVDQNTLFQIGSVTKIMTTVLIIKLAEDGKLSITDPVIKYIPDLLINKSTPSRSLTIRSLLDFSAGFEGDIFIDFGFSDLAITKYVEACKNIREIHEPGNMRSYNSTSYVIASRLVEVVTGKTFEVAFKDYLLKPLRIESYAYYKNIPDKCNIAFGHNSTISGTGLASPQHMPYVLAAAGSTVSMNASSLLKFSKMLMQNGMVENIQYLNSESASHITEYTKKVPPNDSELIMGWAKLPTEEGHIFASSGATNGQNALILVSHKHNFALALLTNIDNGAVGLLTNSLIPYIYELTEINIIKPGSKEPHIDDPVVDDNVIFDLNDIVGEYINTSHLIITKDAEELILKQRYSNPSTNEIIESIYYLKPTKDGKLQAFGADKKQMMFVIQPVRTVGNEVHHILLGDRIFAKQ